MNVNVRQAKKNILFTIQSNLPTCGTKIGYLSSDRI